MEKVYYGTREAMINEVAALDLTECGVLEKDCKYLVLGTSSAGDYDTEGFSNLRDARNEARHLAEIYNATMCCVG